jgi:hypothetical protein
MIVPASGVKVLIATKPVDFRKGMDGLAAVVRERARVGHPDVSDAPHARAGGTSIKAHPDWGRLAPRSREDGSRGVAIPSAGRYANRSSTNRSANADSRPNALGL